MKKKIIVFKNYVDDCRKEEILLENGITKLKKIDRVNAIVANVPVSSKLYCNSEVLLVEQDFLLKVNEKSASKNQNLVPVVAEEIPWGIEYMGAPLQWNDNLGENIKVGIIDTGVATDHPDLKNNIKGGINLLRKNKSPEDDNGHGEIE